MASAQVESALRCLAYGFGLIFMLGTYGIIQERIMSEPYDGELFRTSVFLVLCNRLFAIPYAIFMAWFRGEDLKHAAPLYKYLLISCSNVAATWCGYESLKYVSFPVQTLGKSFKMMPVMIWGIIISQKRYKVVDWLISLGVTWGVTQFLLTGQIRATHLTTGTSAYGLLLLLGFLVCDGFTSTFQEKLFKDHKTSKYNQMLYLNCGSAVLSASSLLASNGAPQAISFCFKRPLFMIHASGLSIAAVGGQFFIYSQVKEFGALVLAATMNMRQVISIVISHIIYSHPITFFQVVGLCVVFSSLFYKSYLGYISQPRLAESPERPEEKPTLKDEAVGKPYREESDDIKVEMPLQA